MLYERLVRPVAFRIGGGDPEAAHEWTLARLSRLAGHPRLLAALRAVYHVDVPLTVFGVDFPNPVGLAAGMDKNGVALPAWPALGFGFVEVGTVTRYPQPGNPRPRLFRLPAEEAVINRMGFNNAGAAALAERLNALGPLRTPLGISIGKSKITPVADAVEDYLTSLRLLRSHADYIAVNVSSPNTPGLRSLQDRPALSTLLGALRAECPKPLLVKIAPDLTDNAIADLLDVCTEHGVDGLIATNTTAVTTPEQGGLSGRPLAARALEVVTFVAKHTELPVIGVGGIHSVDDARRMLDAGASLIQIYTGLIYRGPGLIRAINREVR